MYRLTLTEALKAIQAGPPDGLPYEVTLACGFTPLHLQTYLAAHLQQSLVKRKVRVFTGHYGDLAGTLEEIGERAGIEGVALVLEWSDLDPRFSYRSAGSWGPSALADIVAVSQAALQRLSKAVEEIAPGVPVAVAAPTLALPPVFHTTGWQASEEQLILEHSVFDFLTRVARRRGCVVVNADRLAEDSPAAKRFDLRGDVLHGFPYTMLHAAAIGNALSRLLAPPEPKKGLITDLDDTFWRGIAGETGAENVAWDLNGHAQLHGLYQRLLASFAAEGVLIGIASKNDPAVAMQALRRTDVLMSAERMFPVEISWNPKSGAVKRILEVWNIAADSVVFVDDSLMELGEVAAAHPGLECLRFPVNDYSAGYSLLRRLRDLFGKPRLSAEDGIRLESIRQGASLKKAVDDGAGLDAFLMQADAVIEFDFGLQTGNSRALDLVNKTNQFNLNGVRLSDGDWKGRLGKPDAIAAAIGYKDKFGPLGTISVVQGRLQAETFVVETWVMSCRAFSRRIEHQVVKKLFERLNIREVRFEFVHTSRNGPVEDFLSSFAREPWKGHITVTRQQFGKVCPALYHRISDRIQVADA